MERGAALKGAANAKSESALQLLPAAESGQHIDLREAAAHFKLSADEGNADGQFHYGNCLLYGQGVPTNYSEAAHYFKLCEFGRSHV
jgi:TPR repeat protein